MTNLERSTVIGVFETRVQADSAIDELRHAGFRDDQIGVIARGTDNEVPTAVTETTGSLAAEGAMAGALAGAGVGGLVGLGVLAGVIPVIGPAIAAGTLGTILLNAAGGAAIASVAGALIGFGIPEEEAAYYEGEIRAGRYVVTVHANGRYEEAWHILQRHGAYCREEKLDNVGEQSMSADPMRVEQKGLHAPKEPATPIEPAAWVESEPQHKAVDIPVRREDIIGESAPRKTAGSAQGVQIPVQGEQVRGQNAGNVPEPVPRKDQGGAPFAAADQPEVGNVKVQTGKTR